MKLTIATVTAALLGTLLTEAVPIVQKDSIPSSTPVNSNNSQCVQTAEEYIRKFEACEPIDCVSSCVFASIMNGGCNADAPTNKYPSTVAASFKFIAWTAGSDLLEKVARLQSKSGSCRSFKDVTQEILRTVGYGEDAISNTNCSYRLQVFDGAIDGNSGSKCGLYASKDYTLIEPTWVSFARLLRDKYDVALPAETVKKLVLNNLDYTASSGCQDRDMDCALFKSSKASAFSQCHPEFQDAYNLTCSVSFATSGKDALQAWKEKYGNNASVYQARALLHSVFGANGYFSGFGLGWNANTGWGGLEFLVDNVNLTTVDASVTDLSYQKPIFSCFSNINTPVRKSKSGNPECLSKDGTTCLTVTSGKDCRIESTLTNPWKSMTVECRNSDYQDSNSWCSLAKKALTLLSVELH